MINKRIETINIYNFEDLPDEGKAKAIKNYFGMYGIMRLTELTLTDKGYYYA